MTTITPLRILLISAAYESRGGVSTHIRYLSKALAKCEGIRKVAILTMPGKGTNFQRGNPEIWRFSFDSLYESKNKREKKLLEPGRRAPYEIILDKVLGRWRKYPQNIIHAHDFDSAYIGIMLKVAFKVPLVITIHRAPTPWKHKKYLESPKDLFMEFMKIYKTFDRIVVPSNASKTVLKEQGFKRKVEVIPNGIDYDSYIGSFSLNHELIKKLGLEDKDIKLILCPVRADEHKDPEVFLKAIKQIDTSNPSHRIKYLITCKAKGNYQHLKRIVSGQYLKDKLIIEEFKYEEMRTLYKRASVCVVPSIRESFGQTVLEAFAFKVPVVAANAGALKELIIHRINGFHFNSSSSEDLAERVNEILADPELAEKLVKKGYKTLIENFDSALMADRYYQLYQKILSEQITI